MTQTTHITDKITLSAGIDMRRLMTALSAALSGVVATTTLPNTLLRDD